MEKLPVKAVVGGQKAFLHPYEQRLVTPSSSHKAQGAPTFVACSRLHILFSAPPSSPSNVLSRNIVYEVEELETDQGRNTYYFLNLPLPPSCLV